MVKKIVKVVSIICKLYIMFDILVWAWIGISNLATVQRRNPDMSMFELDKRVIRDASIRYLKWNDWYNNL